MVKGNTEQSKENLNKALRDREEDIYSDLMERYGGFVVGELRSLILKQPKAIRESPELSPEDFFQEALLRLIERVDQLEFERLSQVGTWLIIVAKRLCINKMKHLGIKEKYVFWWDEVENTGVLNKQFEISPEYYDLHACFRELEKTEQILLLCYYYEGLTQQELADMFGVSRSSIQTETHKLQMKIQRRLSSNTKKS